MGSSLALPLARSGLAPIDDLCRHPLRRGAAISSRVPVTSTDEFADLVVSFNEMVEGLREREALRGHNTELVEELRASRARIVAASNEARRRVERDLHDGAQQNLVLLNLKLGQVERAVADDPATGALVEETKAELDTALAELRDLAHGIYPQVLTSDGLPAALAEAVEDAAVAGQLDSDGTGPLSGRARGRRLLLLPRGAPERGEARGRRRAGDRPSVRRRLRAAIRSRGRRSWLRHRGDQRQRRPAEHGRSDRGAWRRVSRRVSAGVRDPGQRLSPSGGVTWTLGSHTSTSSMGPVTWYAAILLLTASGRTPAGARPTSRRTTTGSRPASGCARAH